MTEKEQRKLLNQVRTLQKLGLPVDQQVLQKISPKIPLPGIKNVKKLA